MRQAHYFPRYSQKENQATNNTLLLFIRLVESSRTKFETFIGSLAGGADLRFSPQWLRIAQQATGKSSVVDGYITQDSIKIAVETKLKGAHFSADQLSRHLEIFQNEDHRLLVLLAPQKQDLGERFEAFRTEALRLGVDVLQTTFEEIISVMRQTLTDRDEEMLELLRDFEEFCSDAALLQDDKFLIFTPPCGPSHLDNEELQLYYCPADRNQRTAKYLGIYADRAVRAIGKIKKVVPCRVDLKKQTVLSELSLTEKESKRILEATRRAPEYGWDISTGHKFFLCDEWQPTDYKKSSKYGIQGHRILDLRDAFGIQIPKELPAIAEGLKSREWR